MSAPVIAHIPRRLSTSHLGGTERVLQEMLPLQRAAGLDAQILTSSALDATPHSDFAAVPPRPPLLLLLPCLAPAQCSPRRL